MTDRFKVESSGSRSRSGSYSRSRSRSKSRRRDSDQHPKRIWIGGLSSRITEDDIRDEFQTFGPIIEVKVRQTSRDTFAFVEYEKEKDAQKAVAEMDQKIILRNRVKVNWAQQKSGGSNKMSGNGGDRGSGGHGSSNGSKAGPPPDARRLVIWVGRLSETTNEDKIREVFDEFGRIKSCQLRANSKDVFCFIEFDEIGACKKAIETMNDEILDGAKLRVDWSQQSGRRTDRFKRSVSRGGERRGRSRERSFDRYRSKSRGRTGGRQNNRSRSRDRYDRRRGGNDRGGDRGRRQIPKGKYKIMLENLPPEMTWMDLKQIGRKFGGGDSVTFSRTWNEGNMLKGILEFTHLDALDDCYENLHDHKINGFRVKCRDITSNDK